MGRASERTFRGLRVVVVAFMRNATSRLFLARLAASNTPETITNCTIDNTAAERRSKNWVVRVQISVSTVPTRGPPRTNTTPKAVAENKNTKLAAEAIAGANAGKV